MKQFKISTPNVFRFLDGNSIEKIIKAKDSKSASDKFYRWIENKYNYSPDIISIKVLDEA